MFDLPDVVVLLVCPEGAIPSWVADRTGSIARCVLPPVVRPGPGCLHGDATRMSGGEQVESEHEASERDLGAEYDGDEAGRPVWEGVGHSIRPGTPVPATVLVAEMTDGSLLLHGCQDGTNAYLCPQDAGPLRQALAAAFGIKDALAGERG